MEQTRVLRTLSATCSDWQFTHPTRGGEQELLSPSRRGQLGKEKLSPEANLTRPLTYVVSPLRLETLTENPTKRYFRAATGLAFLFCWPELEKD